MNHATSFTGLAFWTRAAALIAPRIALVAQAAHALPPSGAQGLNLSLLYKILLPEPYAGARQTMWSRSWVGGGLG